MRIAAHLPSDPVDDIRPVTTDANETWDMLKGARDRGFTETQVEYLRSCVGLTWAKAYRKGQANK